MLFDDENEPEVEVVPEEGVVEDPAAVVDDPVVEQPKSLLEQLAADPDFVSQADALRDNGQPVDVSKLSTEQRMLLVEMYNATRAVAEAGKAAAVGQVAANDQRAAEVEAARLRQLEEGAKAGDGVAALDKLIAELKAEAAKPIPDTIDSLSDEAIDARIQKQVNQRLAAIFERQKAEAKAVTDQRTATATAETTRAKVVARNAEIAAYVNSEPAFEDDAFFDAVKALSFELNGDPKQPGYVERVKLERVTELVKAQRGVAAAETTVETARRSVTRSGNVVGATMPKFESEAEEIRWMLKNPALAKQLAKDEGYA
jgi:hypothetical protein